MDKLDLVEDYIYRCDSFIGSNNKANTKLLVKEIIAIFHSEIKDIEFTLASYYYGLDASYEKDLTTLKPILVNYRANIKREEDMRKDELEKLKLQQ
jgi:ADP-dependent phosphofructokinase/glucokinase